MRNDNKIIVLRFKIICSISENQTVVCFTIVNNIPMSKITVDCSNVNKLFTVPLIPKNSCTIGEIGSIAFSEPQFIFHKRKIVLIECERIPKFAYG